jgi:hypothetical protein
VQSRSIVWFADQSEGPFCSRRPLPCEQHLVGTSLACIVLGANASGDAADAGPSTVDSSCELFGITSTKQASPTIVMPNDVSCLSDFPLGAPIRGRGRHTYLINVPGPASQRAESPERFALFRVFHRLHIAVGWLPRMYCRTILVLSEQTLHILDS